MTRSNSVVVTVFLVFLFLQSHAQDLRRFRKEVAEIKAATQNFEKKKLNLFTGSSSIRMWSDLARRFPGSNVINTAFGGSHMSELFYYAPELITDFKPSRIFIYEGDNDLGDGETTEEILSDADKVLKMIRQDLGKKVKVYFITPKPSIARWHLKEKYTEYIQNLKQWASSKENVYVIDVWAPMIDPDGKLKSDLFIEDGLHMNSKGYDIWTKAIEPFLLKK
jgi:lysophospholipase L1-like esterase